jgi:hypothetical protein
VTHKHLVDPTGHRLAGGAPTAPTTAAPEAPREQDQPTEAPAQAGPAEPWIVEPGVHLGVPEAVLEARLWGRVDKSGACWVWTGSLTAQGYGHMRVSGGYDYTHRIAYQVTVGPIPPGLVIDHLCRNRACCNPDHLEPVTHAENNRRGLGGYRLRARCKNGHDVSDPESVYTAPRGDRRCRACATEANDRATEARRSAGSVAPQLRTHCPSGHAYTPENTCPDKHGHRRCRECARANSRRQYLKRKGVRA